ncbi:BnaC06g30950D [Brassica napus]|uniref:BnaC06g30950D protein n=1 Tax=Brassica napus TaxID=3708 RepID=A0A078FFB4_BRANA|nr:BnaC06g30950D [Brassica napus]
MATPIALRSILLVPTARALHIPLN